MAKLEDLKAFDREFMLALASLDRLTTERNLGRNVWSEKQEKQFALLEEAVHHMFSALSELVNANR